MVVRYKGIMVLWYRCVTLSQRHGPVAPDCLLYVPSSVPMGIQARKVWSTDMLHSIFYVYTLTGWPRRIIKGDMVSFLVTRSSKAAGLQQYNWCHGTESAAVSRKASWAGGWADI